MHRAPLLALGFAFLVIAGPAFAAASIIAFDVAGVEKGNVLNGRPTGDTTPYARGSGVCFFRDKKGAACGFVVEATAAVLRVKLTHGSNKFVVGEKLRAAVVERYARAGDQTRRTASTSSSTTTAQAPRGGNEEWARILLAGGGMMNVGGSSFFNGFLDFEYAFSPHLSLSLRPVVVPYPELFGIGGILSGVYHFGTAYKSFFIGVGAGYYNMSASTAINQETIGSLAFQLTVGYRFVISGGLSVGVIAGGTYLTKTRGDLIDLNLSSTMAMGGVDFGYSF